MANSQKLHSQGSIVSTDNSLDLAVDGGEFFQVLLPDGQIVLLEMVHSREIRKVS